MKVLLADDDRISRSLVAGLLTKAGYAVVLAESGDEALAAALAEDGPRLLVLDWVMPGLTGPEVIQRLRAQEGAPFRYAILLSLRHRSADLVAGFQSGADDYVRKPCDPRELLARVRVGERMLALQDKLTASNRALERLANLDGLTELRNRRSLMLDLEGLAARCADERRPLGLAMLDIDRFKRINDQHGHPVGDLVLRAIAGRLLAQVREPAIIGRYGGEEFLVVAPGVEPSALEAIGQRLLRVVHDHPIACPAGALAVTASIGLSCRLPAQALTVADLLKQADAALYRAKHSGRDCVCAAWDEAPPAGAMGHAA